MSAIIGTTVFRFRGDERKSGSLVEIVERRCHVHVLTGGRPGGGCVAVEGRCSGHPFRLATECLAFATLDDVSLLQ